MTEPKNLINLQWFAEGDEVKGGDTSGIAANGSAEGGKTAAAGNAELLNKAFNQTDAAGADGKKPVSKPDGDNEAGGKGTGSGVKNKLAPWTDQLRQDMRDNPEIAAKFAKFASIPEFAKAYLELEGKSGSAVFPGKDALPETVAEFWEKAGKPKAADGYSFAKDKDSENAAFAAVAFTANLTETQADAMLKGLREIGERNQKAFHERLRRKQVDTVTALEKEYGGLYKENMEYLTRGLTAAGPNVASLLSNAGLAGEMEIIKAFIAYGKMTAESGFTRGVDAGASMKSILEGGSFDYKD